jgi:hypothetical protein
MAGVAGAAVVLAVSGCTSSVTAAKVDNAIGPEFAALYARQQQLVGRPLATPASASASCSRANQAQRSTGAGDDWVCQLVLIGAGSARAYTYELNVKADGCFVADGPPALVGGLTLSTPKGGERVNPLFAFDGCFEV